MSNPGSLLLRWQLSKEKFRVKTREKGESLHALGKREQPSIEHSELTLVLVKMAVRSWATCHHRGQEHLSAHGSQVILSCINHVPVKHSAWLDRRKTEQRDSIAGQHLREPGAVVFFYLQNFIYSWKPGVFIDWHFELIVNELYHTPPVKENGITLKAHQNLSFLLLLI